MQGRLASGRCTVLPHGQVITFAAVLYIIQLVSVAAFATVRIRQKWICNIQCHYSFSCLQSSCTALSAFPQADKTSNTQHCRSNLLSMFEVQPHQFTPCTPYMTLAMFQSPRGAVTAALDSRCQSTAEAPAFYLAMTHLSRARHRRIAHAHAAIPQHSYVLITTHTRGVILPGKAATGRRVCGRPHSPGRASVYRLPACCRQRLRRAAEQCIPGGAPVGTRSDPAKLFWQTTSARPLQRPLSS